MNKIPRNFRLLPEVIDGLEILSDRYKMPFTRIIEELILDRASISDQSKNSRRRTQAWIEYQTNRPIDHFDRKRIFDDGYNLGWIHFQTRHREDNLMIELLPEIKEDK